MCEERLAAGSEGRPPSPYPQWAAATGWRRRQPRWRCSRGATPSSRAHDTLQLDPGVTADMVKVARHTWHRKWDGATELSEKEIIRTERKSGVISNRAREIQEWPDCSVCCCHRLVLPAEYRVWLQGSSKSNEELQQKPGKVLSAADAPLYRVRHPGS
uniref:Uncharacterized protein n=1 Tax=Oryza meridionalis TaxID=40149 RepID=A0A0E0C9R7_9ORYZ